MKKRRADDRVEKKSENFFDAIFRR